MDLTRKALLLVFCNVAICAAAGRPAVAEIKDLAHFQRLLPNTPSFVRGHRVRISAKVEMIADPEESIESTALLTVNGQSFKPFYVVVTPGEIRISEEFAWYVVATGYSLTVRFRLILIGNKSKQGFEVVDVTRDYRVRPARHRPKKPSKSTTCSVAPFFRWLSNGWPCPPCR